jgi:membrane protein DedA with SNARE-associated domain/membrane-associated phospholipid phosphatase
MGEWLQPLLDWVARNPNWAGAAVFVVSFSESMAIVGLLVPGVAMMFVAGALIAAGALDFWPIFAWAVAGAVAGDGLSFWLGSHFKEGMRLVWPFSRHPEMLVQGEAFFDRYGGKSVAFGRFFGPVRAVIPLVAGMMGMPRSRFFTANVLSALAWAPAYLLPGVVVGASLQLAAEVAGRLVLLLVLFAAVLWLLLAVTHRTVNWLQPRAARLVAGALTVGERHRVLREIAHALGDPAHPDARGLGLFAFLLLAAMLLFVLAAGLVIQGGVLGGIDQLVLDALQSLRSPYSDRLMVAIGGLGDLRVALLLTAGVAAMLWHAGHRRTVRYWLAAAAFALIAPWLLQHGLRIPRPPTAPAELTAFGFPSGYVLRATVLYGFLAIVVARPMAPAWRWLPYSTAVAIVGAVAMSRLYLGAHWLSDTVGSLTLGVAWLGALGLAYHRHARPEPHWLRVSGVTAAVLAVALGARAFAAVDAELATYRTEPPTLSWTMDGWWEQDWRTLPATRDDLRRSRGHPLTLQYAGSLDAVQARLTTAGWQRVSTAEPRDTLKLLSTSLPLRDLPVLPQVHDGRHESLVMVKPDGDGRRWVLRLWPAWRSLDPGAVPLWIGNVGRQERRELVGMLAYPVTTDGFGPGLEVLVNDLGGPQVRAPDPARTLLLVRSP